MLVHSYAPDYFQPEQIHIAYAGKNYYALDSQVLLVSSLSILLKGIVSDLFDQGRLLEIAFVEFHMGGEWHWTWSQFFGISIEHQGWILTES